MAAVSSRSGYFFFLAGFFAVFFTDFFAAAFFAMRTPPPFGIERVITLPCITEIAYGVKDLSLDTERGAARDGRS